jgi:hypothetical protein
MKVIYAWIALLLIVIVFVGLFIIQFYTMPVPSSKTELPRLRTNLAEKYEKRADLLSDSAIAIANRLKTIQGTLTPEQENKINRILYRAKELKANATKIKSKRINATESSEILNTCNVIYGEASSICKQLNPKTTK